MITVLGHRTLYRDPQYHAAFPASVRLARGAVLLAFRRAPDHRWLLGEAASADFDHVDHLHFKSHIAALELGDDLSVRRPVRALPSHGFLVDQDANLLRLPSGTLLLHSFAWLPVSPDIAGHLKAQNKISFRRRDGHGPEYSFWGAFVRRSLDDGASWSEPIFLPRALAPGGWGAHPEASGGAAMRGRGTVLPDGSVLLPGYSDGTTGTGAGRGVLYRSQDDGLTWSLVPAAITAQDSAVTEPALCLDAAGQVHIVARSTRADDSLLYGRFDPAAQNLPDTLPVNPMGVQGHPGDMHALPDGRILLVYGYRHAPYGIRARILNPADGTDTAIAASDEVVVRDDGTGPDLGYPWIEPLIETGGNTRYAVFYYRTDSDGLRTIAASLLEISA